MTIGKVPRYYRNALGLTQEEMASDILTTSFYSKVERDLHRISVEDLFNLLDRHDIKLVSFYQKYKELPKSLKMYKY